MRAAFALVLICRVLPRCCPGRRSPAAIPGKPMAANGVIEAVQVDAVAVDSTGHLATGLGVKDFEVLHDGRAQNGGEGRVRRYARAPHDGAGGGRSRVDTGEHAPGAVGHPQIRRRADEAGGPDFDSADLRRHQGRCNSSLQTRLCCPRRSERLQFCPWTRAEAGAEAREQALALGLGTVRHAIDYLREEAGRKAVVLISENLRERGMTRTGHGAEDGVRRSGQDGGRGVGGFLRD